jgi:hypothetical protein
MKFDLAFLTDVWGRAAGWVSVPVKSSRGVWYERHPYKWPEDKKAIIDWIRKQVAEGSDCYFCPTPLSQPRRRASNVLPTHFLWADLDEADPRRIKPKPTLAWESSPGRYQALWQLKRKVSPQDAARLSKRLTYATGADPGGWDLTQVLRIPGTFNNKYDQPFRVRVLWNDGPVHSIKELNHLPEPPESAVVNEKIPKLGDLSAASIREKYRGRMSGRLVQLLGEPARHVEGQDRSARLWEIECLLAEAGLEPREILVVAQASSWNKFAGRPDEIRRLWTEALKAHATVQVEVPMITTSSGRQEPRLTTYSQMMAMRFTQSRWQIDDIWGTASHGIVAGEPKSYKSMFTTEMVVCIASGVAMYGKFKCNDPGPVLVIQEENTPWLVQDRLLKIANARGLLAGKVQKKGRRLLITFPPDLPIYFLNNYGFDLSLEEDRMFLEETIARIKPKAIILDPLYLVLGDVDENNSRELRPILNWLNAIKFKHHCSIIIVHHNAKHNVSPRGGQRMLGSTTLHGWVESAIYLTIKDEAKHLVEMERESRAFPKRASLELAFEMEDPGQLGYLVRVSESKGEANEILDLIYEHPGITLLEMADKTGKARRVLLRIVSGLETVGKIVIEDGGGRGKPSKLYPSNRGDGHE